MYSATNVELVTRSRTEHLSDQDKLKSKGNSVFEKLYKLLKSVHKQQQRELMEFMMDSMCLISLYLVSRTKIEGAESRLLLISPHYFHSGSRTPLQSFLGIAEQHTTHNGVRASAARTHTHTHPPAAPFLISTHCFALVFPLE